MFTVEYEDSEFTIDRERLGECNGTLLFQPCTPASLESDWVNELATERWFYTQMVPFYNSISVCILSYLALSYCT